MFFRVFLVVAYEEFELLFYFCFDFVFYSLHVDEEGFGRAKLQEHVETHRHVVVVVGDIEVDDALVFTVFEFHIR